MILVDTCTLNSVFSSKAKDHSEFEPIHAYLFQGRGKFVYGGTKYAKELKNAGKYLRFIVQLEKASKTFKCKDDEVDSWMKWVESQENDADFDDPHLIAIAIVSKKLVFCTKDRRAIPFLKKKSLYPKRFSIPRIYSSAKNKDLLK